MSSTPRSTARRWMKAVAVALFATGGSIAVTHQVAASGATQTDVMAWLAAVNPAINVDQSNNCMAGATDAVAYLNNRIVLRTNASNAAATATVNSRLNAMYGTSGLNYVGSIERITFPNTPPANSPVIPVLSVNLLPRPGGLHHDILRLARRLRSDSHVVASPDYALTQSGPYNFYWPHGYPEKISTLTQPRALPSGLPIGSGVKVEVYDTGLATSTASELPTTTKLSSTDDDQVDIVNNGPNMVDFPPAGHGKAIAGVISTIAPAATIQEVRINDRSGLATDVSAARGMASSLRTLSRPNYPDLIVNAFGTPACDLDPTAPGDVLEPVGLEAVVEVVDKFDPYQADGMLIVASAGNMATTRPHYPAAFTSVLSVGALDGTLDSDLVPWTSASRTAPLADFTNRGTWVDAYAVGVDLPTTHVTGSRFEYGGDIIQGKASVDGTSFAAPDVVAMIAEEISTSVPRLKARAAWDVIAAAGTDPLPQCGTTEVQQGVAVVLQSLTATVTAPATASPLAC